MLKTVAAAGVLSLSAALAACATAMTPTPEQRAACEKMLAEMGEGATHSHAAEKSGAVNAMGITHAQCRRLLRR